MCELADKERELVARLMGRTPRGTISVAGRCPVGHPSVITCYPLRRKGNRLVPFPTLYWLICPRLCKQLADLERDGAIAQIAAELADDTALQARLLQDHEDYIADRWATLSPEDRLLVAEQRLEPQFRTRGIGGMVNRAAIKCLHLHLAHHLASRNAIGELVMRRYGVRGCGAV